MKKKKERQVPSTFNDIDWLPGDHWISFSSKVSYTNYSWLKRMADAQQVDLCTVLNKAVTHARKLSSETFEVTQKKRIEDIFKMEEEIRKRLNSLGGRLTRKNIKNYSEVRKIEREKEEEKDREYFIPRWLEAARDQDREEKSRRANEKLKRDDEARERAFERKHSGPRHRNRRPKPPQGS